MEALPQTEEPLVERRRLPRLKVSAPLQFRNVLKPSEPFAGSLTRDLSAGGVAMVTSFPLSKEMRVVALLSLPGLLKPIRTIGRVAWVETQKFGDGFDCGIQFFEMTPEDHDAVASYVERGVTPLPSRAHGITRTRPPTGSRS